MYDGIMALRRSITAENIENFLKQSPEDTKEDLSVLCENLYKVWFSDDDFSLNGGMIIWSLISSMILTSLVLLPNSVALYILVGSFVISFFLFNHFIVSPMKKKREQSKRTIIEQLAAKPELRQHFPQIETLSPNWDKFLKTF